jgi:hypothetical protein
MNTLFNRGTKLTSVQCKTIKFPTQGKNGEAFAYSPRANTIPVQKISRFLNAIQPQSAPGTKEKLAILTDISFQKIGPSAPNERPMECSQYLKLMSHRTLKDHANL